MNLNPLASIRARREQRALEVTSEIYKAFIGAYQSSSGITVNKDTALASVAVTGCIIVRAESFAALPADVIKRDGKRRDAVDDHPVAYLLKGRWNELVTAPEGWRWKQATEDLAGNAYVRIEHRGGRPYALWPMTGEKPSIKVDGRTVAYDYKGDEFTPADTYPASSILHFKGPVLATPYEGKSLIEVARETIGLSIATEQFYARMVRNGNHFPQHLETDKALDTSDVTAIAENLKALAGLSSAGQMRIFDRGLKVVQDRMSIKDADLTAEQRWLLEQVCRIFRVPKSLVQDWADNTYTNAEQANLWFAQHTITPICVNTEKVLNTRLFLESERGLYVKFNVNGLLRGDFKTRMEGYQAGILGGFMLRSEARELEDWNPVAGLDKPLVPLNTGIIGEDGLLEGGAVAPSGPDATALIDDARARIITRAKQDAERGRDAQATRAFADKVAAPLVAAGFVTDPAAFISDALATLTGDKEA